MEMFFPFGASAIKPEPIDLTVKVILIGDRNMYEMLYKYEEEFRKIFKVRVEFDEEMEMSDEVIRQYSGRLRQALRRRKIVPVRSHRSGRDASNMACAWRGGAIKSRRALPIWPIWRAKPALRGAAAGETPVPPRTCDGAREAKIERHNLIETKIREMIAEGTLLIDTEGSRVGQVNGLSVMEIGGYMFGKPVRITASAALGKSGLINIEREANLSGSFHDKGMHIISGYLRSQIRAG